MARLLPMAVLSMGKLYQGGYKSFYCIDVATGKVDWKFTDINNYCQARPGYCQRQGVVRSLGYQPLLSRSEKPGALIWKWNNGKAQNLYSPANCVPAVHDGKAIIVAPDRYMTAARSYNRQTVVAE